MKGIYCLLINVSKNLIVKIGALGSISFAKGGYVYVGSAQNNLEKRVARHLTKKKKLKWHIDYLLSKKSASVKKIVWKKAGRDEECRIASLIAKSAIPIKYFGCSDCSCISHLFKIKEFYLKGLKVL